jgi:ATP/maltotriose-dependent transcriptional regulator MalT
MGTKRIGPTAGQTHAEADEGIAELEAALAERPSGELWERLGRELYVRLDYPGTVEAHEHAFAAYRSEGDMHAAGRAARIVAWMRWNLSGDLAVANGWLARAARVLAEVGEETSEHGWIELVRARDEPLGSDSRERLLETALELARRFGDLDLEFSALARLGHAYVLTGRVEEGMLMLDEALAAACAGEVRDLFAVETLFCALFEACEGAQDVTRAEQWMRAGDEVVQRNHTHPVGAFCRAHYAGILTSAGRWDEAERELDQAARIFGRTYARNRAGIVVRLADLRVRQGRLEEAALLLEGLDQHPDAARPVAAMHLARGETALARAVLERKLSQPALHPPVAAALLDLAVDAALAEGDVPAAVALSEELSDLAARVPGADVEARAALAKGKVCLASGEGDARACLRDALAAFSLAEMPHELARVRLELARASAREQPEIAVSEAKAALEAFELRRASRDADDAAALLRSLGAAGRSGPRRHAELTKRETEVLDLLGHGLSNAEIAARLFITAKTAEHHVGRILRKLGLRNRAEAAAFATRTAGERSGHE